MIELDYPFNSGYILQNTRKIKRSLLSEDKDWVEKKVAILGGSTTAGIKSVLEVFLLNHGIKADFYESEYNKFYEDAVFSNAVLDKFKPDIVYLHTTNRNVMSYPSLSDTDEAISKMLSGEGERFRMIWDHITARFHCPIIQNNFEMPFYRLMGNRDAFDIHGAVNYLTRLNLKFYEYANSHENFFVCDINYISADYGLNEWSDQFYWYMYKYALNVNAIPVLAFNVANIIKSVFGKNKKGFVLDLDNTLWGGVVGDDGPENLKIGPEDPAGQVYEEFQRYIKAHEQLGIIFCIDSKNDESNAAAGLNHGNCILKPDDFAVIKANWEPKDINFSAIANELSVLPESLVFVDDNPAERQIVTQQLPGVKAPDIGASHQYIKSIDRCGFFETTYLSADDANRSQMYKENASRAKLAAAYSDYGEFLDSLKMVAAIRSFEPIYMERIAQLTNKSNQFNLTARRFTQPEIEGLSQDGNFITLYGKLEDKFGDNGVVSAVIGEIKGDGCHVALWLMSCRVLKRDMEFAMMDALAHGCISRGAYQIFGYYYPTAKNGMVKEFYKIMGFEMISENNGATKWKLSIDDGYKNKNRHIKMEG